MTFLKLLLNINLIFFVTITIVAGKNSENNLIFLHPSYIIALHYDIKISLPHSVTNYTFYGESNVNIIVRHPTQRINLHSVFVDMDKSASLFHEISRRVYKASNYTCQYKLFVCTFHFHDLITIGSYIFKMKYHGTITDRENADGFVITSYLDDERKLKWIYSAGGFQNTIGGQYVFPSLNELMFKATFNITVFHPKHFVAISNMPAATRKNINMNTVRVNFQTTPAMHPHLVAIAVSELDALYSDNGNIALWVRDISVVELMHFTLQVIVASTTYLRDKYFQDDKLNDISTTNHVVIPYHRDDGLPNWGIIFYSEKDVVYNEEWNSIERKTEIASLVARKVTHQFLNKITLSNLQMMNLIIVRNRFETLHLESIINTPPIVLQIEEPYGIKSYSSFRYNKAFLIIRMLYHLLSDKVFKKGIYNYLKNHLLKAHMLSIVHNLFEEIGYYNQVYDHIHAISIREEAAEWACFFGDKICRETAYKELQTYMKLAVMHKRPVHRTFIKFISKRRKENEFVFYGESILLFQDINKKRVLRLHARNLVINTVATKIRYFANGMNNEIAPKEHIVHKKQQTIDIIFDYPFLQGIDTYRVIVKFLGSIPDNTGGITGKNDKDFNNKKTWLFAADLQGAGARQLFPCWDEPNIRTNFTISVKHDQYYSVLSNTEAIDNFKVRLGKNWSRFETTVKISPYHIMIILHKFKRLNDSNVWCRKNVEQQVKWIHTIAKIATLHLKLKYDDIIYPLTVTHVIIPGFQDTGMSSWGIVLHRETDVLYDKKLDFIAKKFEMAFMIARKMAHQYIGNLLAQSSWSYLWLNEGIATFLAMKIVKQHEHPQLMDLFVVKFQHESLRLNDYYNMSLIDEVDTSSDIASLFPLTYYVRAPIFIRSLDKALPEEILDISINDYISKYKFKSVNTSTSTLEYFLNVIQNNIITEVPEEYKEYTNIIEIFTQWAKQERYPVLQVSQRMSSPNEVKVYIAEPYPKKWSIYVTYITQKNPNIGHKVWLKEPHTDLYLPVNNSDWIIINVEQAGYYRVNYNNNNWEKLGNYLNSREYTNIHVLNRAQIIDDAYYFMSTNNKLNFNIFKALTYYLSKETNYIAWYPMFKILEQISGFFPFLQSSEVKEHFRKILDNVLEKIGYTDIMEENNFTKCLRLEAAKWACTLGSQKCTTTASSELIQLYKKPNLYE
ncbi:Aminopeptidase N [Cyphomyrmex costatus]|uniref:Aminopeptidase N n=1 Tax=Cyphomyrmex costatus TaxID=456900 RepID=A0A195D5J2_9HYME|nr:Aminopeptidase N [Cyphomyrmex costatus]